MKKLLFSLIILSLVISGCALTKDRELGDVIAPEEAKAKAEEFINSYLVDPGNEATVVLVEESDNYSDYYKVTVDTANTKGIESLISKDGKKFIMRDDSVNMEEYAQEMTAQAGQSSQQTATPTSSDYSEADLVKVSEFVSCLKEKDFVVYGADWCGYTQALIKILGGSEVIKPVYVECTEEKELCAEKVDQGYPTVRIKDETYNGGRTLESFGQATGCPVPQLSATQASVGDASCGS